MKRLKHLVFAVTCLGTPMLALDVQPAGAVTVSRTRSYFTITGNTPGDIEAQMLRLGPTINGSKTRHPGATRMAFSTKITYGREAKQCSIVKADVIITATVILPRWRHARRPDMAARLYWDALSSDIVRHEEGHVNIAKNKGRELEKAIQRLHSASNCDMLADAARAEQDSIMTQHDREQQEFDRVEGKTVDTRLLRQIKRRIDRLIGQ